MRRNGPDRWPVFAGLLLTLLLPPRATADGPAGLSPPRVKPSAERSADIRPWERNSAAPWGGARWGGRDARTFTFSPDGRVIAGQDAGGWQVELWETASGKSLGRFGRLEEPVVLAFAPGGKILITAVAEGNGAGAVDLWDVGTRKRLRSLDEGVCDTPFSAVAFSPDGKSLALAVTYGRGADDKPGVAIWDVATGDEVRSFDGPAIAADSDNSRLRCRLYDAVCFAPDGRSLVIIAEDRVWLWEYATGKPRGLLGVLPSADAPGSRSDDRPVCAAVSPDGRTLAVVDRDGAIRLYDLRRGQPLPPLVGHRGRVRAVGFAPDGKSLTSLGSDNALLTWPLEQVLRPWRPRRDQLPAQTLDREWQDLLEGDALAIYAAAHNLAARPGQALALLRERVKPVPAIDSARVAKLVEVLAQQDYNARKRAAAELGKFGDLALPALRAASRGTGSSRSLVRMQQRLEAEYPTREQLRALRALEILELTGTPEASKLLDELAGGATEAPLTIRAKVVRARMEKAAAPAAPRLPSDELWAALADEEARLAFAAMRLLWADPDKAVPFLRERMRPLADRPSSEDPQSITRLIRELDSDDFNAREKATKELSELGTAAEAALRKALDGRPSAEAQRRLEQALRDMDKLATSPERLRASRGLEVLEHLGDDRARQALEWLAKESKNLWLKESAAESLKRLNR
jgi:hypothetical protein